MRQGMWLNHQKYNTNNKYMMLQQNNVSPAKRHISDITKEIQKYLPQHSPQVQCKTLLL